MMKERPILFSASMVRAILEGRKTMTRRVVKTQADEIGYRQTFDADKNIWLLHGGGSVRCPYGLPGDRLWVRETWAYDDNFHGESTTWYRADSTDWGDGPMHWEPSIFMPRWASRIILEVTAVRVERVQDIAHKDALREGVSYDVSKPDGGPLDRFRLLWESINAKRGFGWDANPWVWVVEFRRINVPKS